MANEGDILLTVMLKHQQDKNLAEINAKLDSTEFHPTYDFRPMAQALRDKA